MRTSFISWCTSVAIVSGLCASSAYADPKNGTIMTANDKDPGENPGKAAGRDDALRMEATALRGIPFGQALKAVRAQEALGEGVSALRQELGGRVAGISVVYDPEYKVIVRLKGNASPSKRMLVAASGDVPVEFVTGASSSVEEMVANFDRNLPAIRNLFPTLQGIGTDEKTGEIAIVVYATGSAAQAAKGKRDDLFKLLGHPVRIDTVEQAAVDSDVRGGSKITEPAGGYCTSGFSVKNASGTTAMSTAAHCEGINTYYNSNGTTIALTHTGIEIKDADQDVELHTSGYVESAEFYADTTASARILTGKRLQSSTAAGNQVCHRGETTGYSCGLVGLTNFKPTYANACGAVTCDSVWIKVDGDAHTACFQGDSGGPVFASQTAFGLLKGTSASGKAKGQCTWFAYMSTDRLPTGWSLVFG